MSSEEADGCLGCMMVLTIVLTSVVILGVIGFFARCAWSVFRWGWGF